MYIRKRSFFEMLFPLTCVFFICIGASFMVAMGAATLRWIFVCVLFLYLVLNKKLLIYLNDWLKALLFIYLIWCISTTLWSEIPILSFVKSTIFAFNIIVMLSAGSLWVVRYGYARSFDWLFFVALVALLSGFMGGAINSNFYHGLLHSANDFGFLMAVVSPLLFLKLYQSWKKRSSFFIWLCILIATVYFLIFSYSRSGIVIFLCILGFFVTSLPLSKKILIAITTFFCVTIILAMIPLSDFENLIIKHITKNLDSSLVNFNTITLADVTHSRTLAWEKSYQNAIKGGIIGDGFSMTIGDAIDDTNFSGKLIPSVKYAREKGNSQFAIIEETGMIGFILYLTVLICFFAYVIPYYRCVNGLDKVAMGITLGAMLGLLLQSIVEAWWDSTLGQELIYFWTMAGIMHGMIYLQKRKLSIVQENLVTGQPLCHK